MFYDTLTLCRARYIMGGFMKNVEKSTIYREKDVILHRHSAGLCLKDFGWFEGMAQNG